VDTSEEITAAGHKDKSLEYGKDVSMRYLLPTQHALSFGNTPAIEQAAPAIPAIGAKFFRNEEFGPKSAAAFVVMRTTSHHHVEPQL